MDIMGFGNIHTVRSLFTLLLQAFTQSIKTTPILTCKDGCIQLVVLLRKHLIALIALMLEVRGALGQGRLHFNALLQPDLILQALIVQPLVVVLRPSQCPLVAGVIFQHGHTVQLLLGGRGHVMMVALDEAEEDGVEVLLAGRLIASVQLLPEGLGLVVDETGEVTCSLLLHHK